MFTIVPLFGALNAGLNIGFTKPIILLCFVIANIIIFIAVMSVGIGLFQPPNNSLVMSTVPKNKLGIAGSINSLVRNLGMICGIVLATTLLYSMMSLKIGYHVTDYVVGRNDAFIYGMKVVYITAAIISLVGAVLTFFRLHSKKIQEQLS